MFEKPFALILAIITSLLSPISVPAVKPPQTAIIFTGDVMLGRSVMVQSVKKQDYIYPFRLVSDQLSSADLTMVNLENPIVERCPMWNGSSSLIFCADPKMLQGMSFAGVDIVNLANNHTQNYGKEGFTQTKKYLEGNNISYTGDNNLVTKKLNGTRFGFLGFEKSQQNNPKLTLAESDLIKQSDSKVDVLIVNIHWGVEYEAKAREGQRRLAREMVNLGTDVIVGHHPHWVQDMEKIDGKPVYYSLGNFVFDQMWSEETKKGLVIKLIFEGKELVHEEQMRVYIRNIGQPEFVLGTGFEPM